MNIKPGLAETPLPHHWVEVLRGGDRVLIRPIHPGDMAMERAFIEGLSPRSRRFRFLDTMRSPSEALLKQMTDINPLTDVAYVAVIDSGAHDQMVGVGRFSKATDEHACEFALAVTDTWQKKGVATHLMHHLINAARTMGLERMYSSDASDNDLMRRFASHLRLDHGRDPDDATQILYSLTLPAVPVQPTDPATAH